MTITDPSQLSRHDITEPEFEMRRKGYDPEAVGRHLVLIADHIERLEEQLAARSTDKAALDLLKSAERTARDTETGAQIDANRIRANAATELDNARLEASRLLEASRAEATSIREAAKNEAERIVSDAKREAAAHQESARQKVSALEQKAEEARSSIQQSAADLRRGASSLTELATQFEREARTSDGDHRANSEPSTKSGAIIDLQHPRPPQAPVSFAKRNGASELASQPAGSTTRKI